MESDDINQYSYSVSLPRGFKHRYQILINGAPTIDYNQKYSLNQNSG